MVAVVTVVTAVLVVVATVVVLGDGCDAGGWEVMEGSSCPTLVKLQSFHCTLRHDYRASNLKGHRLIMNDHD